jgi:hypothetical protein
MKKVKLKARAILDPMPSRTTAGTGGPGAIRGIVLRAREDRLEEPFGDGPDHEEQPDQNPGGTAEGERDHGSRQRPLAFAEEPLIDEELVQEEHGDSRRLADEQRIEHASACRQLPHTSKHADADQPGHPDRKRQEAAGGLAIHDRPPWPSASSSLAQSPE